MIYSKVIRKKVISLDISVVRYHHSGINANSRNFQTESITKVITVLCFSLFCELGKREEESQVVEEEQ